LDGGVLDFIIIGIKRKGKRNIPYFEYFEIFEKSKGAKNYLWAILGQMFMLWQLFLPTVSHGTTVRRDPNSLNIVVFWSGWVVVSESAFIPFVSFGDLDNNTFKGLTSLLSVEQEIQYDEHT
jgi:hypothetical protein